MILSEKILQCFIVIKSLYISILKIITTKPTGDSLGEYNSSTASTVDYNTFTQEDVNGLLIRNSEAIKERIENINNANKFEIAGVESNIELVQQEINKNTGTLEQDLLGNETTGLIKQTIDTINQTRVPNKQVLADSVRNFKTLNEFRDFSTELASLNDLYTRTNSLRRLSFFSRNFVDRNFRDIVGNNNLTAQEKLNQSRKTLLDSINDFQGVDNFSGAASRLTDKINSVESIVEIPEIISDLENSLESSITRDLKMDLLEKTENLVDSFDQPLVNKDGTDSQIGVIKRYFNLTSQEQSDLIIKRKASKNFNTREKVINSQLDLFGGNYFQDGDVKRFNNNKTLEDFLTQYHTLRYLRTTGTLPGEYSVSRSLNNIKKIAANIVQVATGGYGIQSQNSNLNESDDLPLNIRQRITKNLAKININQNSLDDVLSNIGRYLKVEEGGNYVANFGNIRNSEEEYLRINSLLVQKVANTIDTHYDGDFLSQFDGKLDELNVAQKKLYGKNKQFALKQDVYLAQELESDTGVRGGGTKLKLRKSQWITLYALWQSPRHKKTLDQQFGSGIRKEIFESDSIINDTDKLLANDISRIYTNDLYQLQNNGSRNLTGFSAARLPFYFGEVQRIGEPNRQQDFSSIEVLIGGVEPKTNTGIISGTESSTKNRKDIVIDSFVARLKRDIDRTTLLATHASVVRKFFVFDDPDVKTAIEQFHGKPTYARIQEYRRVFARGKDNTIQSYNLFDKLRNKTAIAGIGVSVLSGTKQIVSGLSLFADPEVNTIEILAYAKRGIANSTKFARTSETIKQRGAAFNKDVSQFLTEQKKQVKTQESVSNLKDPASLPLLIFTRIGDRLGAIPSASIKFEILKDRFLSQGFTEEVAIAKADRGASTFLNKTQQSDLLSEAEGIAPNLSPILVNISNGNEAGSFKLLTDSCV